jgi:uncharacterized protein (DUF488 family)
MPTLFTIGHGSRALADFLEVLKRAQIETLIDVRAFPGSRRYPHFAREALRNGLAGIGVQYDWQGKTLGGFRKPEAASPHIAIAQDAFRGFADHMGSAQFRACCDELVARAQRERIVIMCAERSPQQCHRSFIADFLLARGAQVIHLLDDAQQPHRMQAAARLQDGELVYDSGVGRLLFD